MNNTELLAKMKELVEKGIIDTSAIATNGKLNPEQADKFIDYVVDLSSLKGKVRVARLKGGQTDIDKIQVGKRVAVPKVEATDPGIRRGVTTSKISMNPKEVMVPFEISDEFEIENLEEMTIEDHIVKMMATQFVNDLEELCISGNTLGQSVVEADIIEGGHATNHIKDGFLALQDGWLTLAGASHVVDFAGANMGPTIFNKMINAMPKKFKRNRGMLKFLCSPESEQNYRNNVASRATAEGDLALMTTRNLTPFGIELVPVPLLDQQPTVVEHVTLSGTTAVQLKHKKLSNVFVLPSNLAGTPTAPYVDTTDYVVDLVNGTLARTGGGGISDGATVKVTYQTESQIILTEYRNLIYGIGRDIRIERDRDIFKSVNQFAMTARVAVQIEETDACVLGKNIGLV